MKFILKLSIILLLVAPLSCSKKIEVEEISEVSVDIQMKEAYEEGMRQLNEGQSLVAVKKFNEAELLFPQSKWAPRAALMSAYSYYDFSFYNDAISEVDRFLKTYLLHLSHHYKMKNHNMSMRTLKLHVVPTLIEEIVIQPH